jgi:NAD(P)-dependent dehydrogenase (short-subunit alcohol dehydrogenase family)
METPQTYRTPVQTPANFPPQHQDTQPGDMNVMNPRPVTDNPNYRPAGKLEGRVAIITGADSGIGQAVAIAFAKEGADIVVPYLQEDSNAWDTQKAVEGLGRRCVPIPCDLKREQDAKAVVDMTIGELKRVDILVNNVAVQFPQNSVEDITAEQLNITFSTNILSYIYMTKAVLPYFGTGSCIINTASITAYKGSEQLIDYSATKGAIVSYTRSLSLSLAKRGIRVNAVAPGPVWTPLIPSSFSAEDVAKFGSDTPLGRAAQPFELAPTYVYLASEDSGFVTGQVLHVNGGVITDS